MLHYSTYTKAKERYFPSEDPGTPADVAVLEEIRDLLATRGGLSQPRLARGPSSLVCLES